MAKKWISPGEWKVFWISSSFLALIVGIVTFLVVFLGKPEEPKDSLPSQSPFKQSIDDTIPKSLLLSDYRFALPAGQWLAHPWVYTHDPSGAWDEKTLKPYWTDPDNLKLFKLPQENQHKIDQLFKDIP
jgi:hypothetical protein